MEMQWLPTWGKTENETARAYWVVRVILNYLRLVASECRRHIPNGDVPSGHSPRRMYCKPVITGCHH